jgi:hypothetical protein
MSKENQDWIVKATETAVRGSAAAIDAVSGSAGVAGAVLVKTGLALVPGVAGAIAKLGIQACSRRLERKIDRWMDLVAIYMDRGSVDAAAEEIKEHIEEEWAHAAVVEGVRAILGDISAAALPFLARLTAYYLGAKKVMDGRGRRFCALLSACDEPVLTALRSIVSFCNGVEWESTALQIQIRSTSDGGDKHLYLAAVRQQAEGGDREIARLEADTSFFEAFHLMKQFRFARDTMSGFYGRISGPSVAVIEKEDLDFIDPFLRAAEQGVGRSPT